MNYQSKAVIIAHNQEAVYTKLTDMRHLEPYLGKLPEGTPTISVIDSESCQIQTPLGPTIVVTYKEKRPYDEIVLCTAPSPMPIHFELQIHLHAEEEDKTSLQLELLADLPAFTRAIFGEKKIIQGLDKVVSTLATLNYDK